METTCVIADDHDVVREGSRARLARVPWLDVVAEARTVDETVDVVARMQPTLALVDMRLAGGEATDVIDRVREAGGKTAFVVFSAYGTPALAQRAFDLGAAGYVLKDSPFETVIAALECARDGRRFVDPLVAGELLRSRDQQLSPREHEVLQLMADGKQNAEIAHLLHISAETVKAHVSRVLEKFGATTRTEAVAFALREAIID